MRAADTNILVRLIARDDDGQLQKAIRGGANGYWVSHLVLAEAIWVLKARYNRTRENIVRIVESILDQQGIVVQEPETIAAALAIFRKNPRLEFTDCMILESARRAGRLPLMTFDRALAKADGAELVR